MATCASETPIIDSMWNPNALKEVYIMMGRLLFGGGLADYDHWDMGLVIFGDTESRELFLKLLSLALNCTRGLPQTPDMGLDIVREDSNRFVAHDVGPDFVLRAIRQNAAVLVMQNDAFSMLWRSFVLHDGCTVHEPLSPPFEIKWDIPVVMLLPSEEAYPYRVVPFSLLEYIVPFRVTPPSSCAEETIWEDLLQEEIESFCAKAKAAYNAALSWPMLTVWQMRNAAQKCAPDLMFS